jgi:hypothetical protein
MAMPPSGNLRIQGVAQDAKDEVCRLMYDFYEGILQLPDAGTARLRPYMFAAHK